MNETEDTVEERVRRVVSEVLALEEPPDLNSSLQGDLKMNSLDLFTLTIALEEEFADQVVVSEQSLSDLKTIRDIVRYIDGERRT